MKGEYKSDGEYYISNYPPEYTKGIGKKGMERLMTFLDRGGMIVSWGRSRELFLKTLEIKHGKNKIVNMRKSLAIKPLWSDSKRGKVSLFGFSPQFRGSTRITVKLIFKAILLPKID